MTFKKIMDEAVTGKPGRRGRQLSKGSDRLRDGAPSTLDYSVEDPSNPEKKVKKSIKLRPWIVTIGFKTEVKSGSDYVFRHKFRGEEIRVYDHVGEYVSVYDLDEVRMQLDAFGALLNDRVVVQRKDPDYWIECSYRNLGPYFRNMNNVSWIRGINKNARPVAKEHQSGPFAGFNEHAFSLLEEEING